MPATPWRHADRHTVAVVRSPPGVTRPEEFGQLVEALHDRSGRRGCVVVRQQRQREDAEADEPVREVEPPVPRRPFHSALERARRAAQGLLGFVASADDRRGEGDAGPAHVERRVRAPVVYAAGRRAQKFACPFLGARPARPREGVEEECEARVSERERKARLPP